MKKIIFCLLIIQGINSYAQTHQIDSLKQALQKEKTDTGRVSLLAALSIEYLESKPDTTMQLGMEGLALSRSIGFIKGEAASLNRIGNAYGILGNYPKAMEVWLQALQINEKINNPDGIVRNWNNIGEVYFLEGDYRQALEYYFKAKSLAEKIGDKKAISIMLVNIGYSYYKLKVYDSAKQYIQQSHDIAEKINYSRVLGASLYFLGAIHFETGLYPLAFDFFRLSIPYSENANDYLTLSQISLGMAKLFEKSGENDSTLYYARRAMSIAQEKGFMKDVLDASLFISHFFEGKQKLDSAFIYQKIAITANDSLFSQKKQRELQSLSFDEKLRQQEIAAAEQKSSEQRKRNLQYAAIAIGLITFVILFLLLSHSIIVKTKFIEFFGILALLAVFEFINLFIHPYLAHATNDSPVLMLGVLIAIGALLIPLHHKLEKWITKIMVEKNKKIRLAAAKKTIATLEG
jgi:tetratricopeptide (TPR) repeat protein